jgi:hypothetical protein
MFNIVSFDARCGSFASARLFQQIEAWNSARRSRAGGNGMIKKRFFSHNGRRFEVRAECTDGDWSIRVYEDNHPAHQLMYSVSHDRLTPGFLNKIPDDVVEQLMTIAQDNIERGLVRVLPGSPAERACE